MSVPTLVASGQEQRMPVEVEAENFTVIKDGPNCVADIVFLHGLQGHPKDTWTFGNVRNQKERGKLAKILHRKPKTVGTSASTSCFWPEDLLATEQRFEDVRILTYGYDSHVSHFFEGSAAQATIVGLGRSFLNDLEGIRRDEPHRPLIFIVHSLGGLVLKEALRRSWRADAYEADLKTIYTSTKAILFMGTPHRGSDYAPWGIIARNIAVAAGFDANDRLLKDLRADSTMLDLLRDEFGKMLKEDQFRVYTFMEGKGLKGVQGLTTKVVGDESSALNDGRERRDIINANHMDMCRFTGPKDSGYRKVKDALAKCLVSLRKTLIQTPAIQTHMFSREADDALAALDIGETRNRFDNVEAAYKDTFEWVFERPELELETWLREGSGLYWIQGKPASGKSTLMKKIYNDRRTRACLDHGEGEKAIPAFFFHDRGSEKQKSLEGLLQAVLYQILRAIPALLPCWLSCYPRWKASPSVTVLSEAFAAILKQSILKVNICLFLDALDEYSGNHQDMTTFLKTMVQPSASSLTKLKVVFSSREQQVFLDAFDLIRVPRQFKLQNYTIEDIDVVIDTKMKVNVRMLQYMNSSDDSIRSLTHKFALEVASRAEGVFLWVRLVLDSLLEEFSAGDSLKSVQKSPLDHLYEDLVLLPKDLEAYYDHILSRIPERYLEETHIMFEVVRCAYSPLTPREFVEVCEVATMSDLRQYTPRKHQCDDIGRLIRSRSGGLIELIDAKHSPGEDDPIPFFIQFIHQTVRSWTKKVSKTTSLVKQKQGGDTGHVYILKYILAYLIKDCELNSAPLDDQTHAERKDEDFDYGALHSLQRLSPSDFQDYLASLLCHAYEAEISTGRSQSTYLNQAADMVIRSAYRDIPVSCGMVCPLTESVLSFAVAASLEFYLQEHLTTFNVNLPLKVSLLHLALGSLTQDLRSDLPQGTSWTKDLIILEMLLNAQASLKVQWDDKTPFQLLCTELPLDLKEEMVSCLLDHGQDPEETITFEEQISERVCVVYKCQPLHHAIKHRLEKAVEALINHGANVNTLDSRGRTPLDCIYWHLGNQIKDFLTSYPKLKYRAKYVPQKLRIIRFLLDNGAKGASDPDYEEFLEEYVEESNYNAYHSQNAPITKDMIQALIKMGLAADNRLVNLPRLQPDVPTRMLQVLGGFRSLIVSKFKSSNSDSQS